MHLRPEQTRYHARLEVSLLLKEQRVHLRASPCISVHAHLQVPYHRTCRHPRNIWLGLSRDRGRLSAPINLLVLLLPQPVGAVRARLLLG